jgi:hypothetical protein
MQVSTFVAIEDVDAIRVLVDRLEVQVSSTGDCIELPERDEEAVRLGIEEIKKKLEIFHKRAWMILGTSGVPGLSCCRGSSILRIDTKKQKW